MVLFRLWSIRRIDSKVDNSRLNFDTSSMAFHILACDNIACEHVSSDSESGIGLPGFTALSHEDTTCEHTSQEKRRPRSICLGGKCASKIKILAEMTKSDMSQQA